MTNRLARLCLAGLLLLAAGRLPAQGSARHSAEAQIRDNEARWNHEFEQRDLAKMVAHYADDATMIAPGFPAFHGRDTIRAGLEQMLTDTAFSLRFETSRVEVSRAGDVAWSEGSYTVRMTDPNTKKPVSSSGSYVTVYRLEAGGWRAVSDIASPGPEPAAQALAEKETTNER